VFACKTVEITLVTILKLVVVTWVPYVLFHKFTLLSQHNGVKSLEKLRQTRKAVYYIIITNISVFVHVSLCSQGVEQGYTVT